MSAQLKSFEGPDVQLLLDRIRAELGPGAKINGAEKIRVGGLLGFFAKEHYRVVVEAPGTATDAGGPDANATDAHATDAGGPDDDRSSRRARRRSATPATPYAEGPEPVSAAGTPAPAGIPAIPSSVTPANAVMPTDVFSAMAEATDDVNDVGVVPAVATPVPAASVRVAPVPVPPSAAPVPVAEVPADDGTDADDGADAVAESFDAVFSRVATSLEVDPADTATPGGDVTAVPAPRLDPPPAGDGTLAGIASKAALFLAETGTGRNGHSPGPHDAVAEALRRTGLNETVVAPVTAGLRHGMGLEALLLEAFGSLPPAAPVPRRTGSLLVVVGAGSAARRLAAALATEIGIDAAEVPFASRHDGAHAVVTGKLLVRSAEDAAELAPGWRRSQAAVVVVDAAVTGSARSWATHLIAALRPTAVWGVVDSTAKTEDIAAWAEALGGVDALALENLDATVSPASCLGAGIPVARIDGQPATATRWAAAIVDRMAPCT